MATQVVPVSPGKPIPLTVPQLRGNESRYIQECLASGWVSTVGPQVERFESVVARTALVKHAVATSSGTAALHVALLIAGIEPGDEVLVSTLSFIAPANAIRYVGAHPVFVDSEPHYWQMDECLLADFLSHRCDWRDGVLVNRDTGRRVKGLLPVHIMGHPVNLDPLYELARHYGLVVVEDAAEAVGADYKARPVGRTDSIATYSFNGNKIVTTGGGGMILTDHTEWADRARYLTTQAKDDPHEYIHGEIGYNYRLTSLQAAMGIAQMEQLESFVAAKRSIAYRYQEALADIPGVITMPEAPWARSTFWLYTILIDQTKFGMDSRELANRLQSAGIQTRPLWQPLHLSKPHQGSPALGGSVAENLYRQSISLPCSVGLDLGQVDEIANLIRRLQRNGSRPIPRDNMTL